MSVIGFPSGNPFSSFTVALTSLNVIVLIHFFRASGIGSGFGLSDDVLFFSVSSVNFWMEKPNLADSDSDGLRYVAFVNVTSSMGVYVSVLESLSVNPARSIDPPKVRKSCGLISNPDTPSFSACSILVFSFMAIPLHPLGRGRENCKEPPPITAFLKSSIARSSSLISSSFIRSQASSMASSSSAFLTSSTSLRLLPVMPATSAPLLGIIITRPSSSSILIASLIGVLLTPRSFARRISTSLSPGERLPFNIACLKVLNTTSLSGI